MSTLSITGEEYVCYGENASGQFTPLIGVVKYDGSFSFREMTKDDLDRIPDDTILPGCWLFRKTMSSQGAWTKRFALLRGGFIFLFHSPHNDKPLAVIPLDKCRILMPDRQEKSFDNSLHSDGFEFDIRHKSRPTVRCYALSELERQELVRASSARCDLPSNIADMLQVQSLLRNMPLSSTIRVSNTRLTGINFAASEMASEAQSVVHSPFAVASSATSQQHQSHSHNQHQQQQHHNPFAAPRPPQFDDDDEFEGESGSAGGLYTSPPPPPPPPPSSLPSKQQQQHSISGSSVGQQPISKHQQYQSNQSVSALDTRASLFSSSSPPPPPQLTHQRLTSLHSLQRASVISQQIPETAVTQSETTAHAASTPVKKLDVTAFANLNSHLTQKVSESMELRDREDSYAHQQRLQQQQQHWQNLSLDISNNANAKSNPVDDFMNSNNHENGNNSASHDQGGNNNNATTPPVTFAELFRFLLFFCDEEMAEDPQPSAQQQFPHAKGAAVDEMLLFVYRAYCDDTNSSSQNAGFMSLEQLCDFLQDCAVLQTHAPPEGGTDEAAEAFQEALAATHLLRSLPRSPSSTNSSALGGAAEAGRVDFGQWYQLLLRIASIVYADLYAQDATVAFSKLLFETIAPLFLICHKSQAVANAKAAAVTPSTNKTSLLPRHRRALLQSDPLLHDARILLVLITYASNLWKVFLTYATDAVGKLPEVSLPFPAAAQLNERGMHKLPVVAPEKHLNSASSQVYAGLTADSWILSESGWLRLCRDYAFSPYVFSNAQLREVYRSLVGRSAGRKTIVSSKLPSREQLAANTAMRTSRKQTNNSNNNTNTINNNNNNNSIYAGGKE